MPQLLPFTLACTILPALDPAEVSLHRATRVRFATIQEGATAISRRDRFVTSMSPFDRQARLKTDRQVGEAEFLEFIAGQVLAWEENEIDEVTAAVQSIHRRLAPFQIPLPKLVLLVKTTGEEENGAAHCRGNAIVLPQAVARWSGRALERLLIHELFHILSAHDEDLRHRLYAVIGFKRCAPIQLPEALRDRKITNPDGATIEYYIELQEGDRNLKAAPILFASAEKYDPERGGTVFSYLQFKLMVVHRAGDVWQPVLSDGEPVLLDAHDSEIPSFFDQVGRNTDYIIHPDEILAENFVHLVMGSSRLKSPSVVDQMRRLLVERR